MAIIVAVICLSVVTLIELVAMAVRDIQEFKEENDFEDPT